jgi:transposase
VKRHLSANVIESESEAEKEESMENPTTVAVDLSKSIFEVAVARDGRICQRKRLSRRQLTEFFSQCERATVVMEACGSSHYWGRKLQKLGHDVRLLPPQHVRPYVVGNKTDRRDCEAILSARHREAIVPVPVKSVEQQSIACLHRLRAAWIKTRTSRLNMVRGILRELGVTIPEGASRVLPAVSLALSETSGPVPEVLHPVLVSVMAEVCELDTRIEKVEEQLEAIASTVPLVERLETIPGVGLLNATALSSMTGDFSRFPSGRRFASSLGLTPKEHSSGMRRRLGAISKRGDTYLRTLLIAGARSVLLSAHRTKRPHRLQEWALDLERRRGRNRAAIALANKLARIVWAVATRGDDFRKSAASSETAPA